MSIVQFFKRFGITTGAAAAAAAKAATMLLIHGEKPRSVTIPTPVGLRLEIIVDNVYLHEDAACASVRKFSGDNVDVLNGISIFVCVRRRSDSTISVAGGRGVGVVTRPGLRIPVGESSISPTAREMIVSTVKEVAPEGLGLDIVVEVPGGEEIAKRTLNEALGIVNGISILGTTGIEWPTSSEEDVHRIAAEINIVKSKFDFIVFATGNKTYDYAAKLYGQEPVVKVGDSIGFAVGEAAKASFSCVVIAIQPSKVLKLAAGVLNTSSRFGDARIEILTHACIVVGLDIDTVKRVSLASSVREALSVIGDRAPRVFEYIAAKAANSLRKVYSGRISVVVFDDYGNVMAKADT